MCPAIKVENGSIFIHKDKWIHIPTIDNVKKVEEESKSRISLIEAKMQELEKIGSKV